MALGFGSNAKLIGAFEATYGVPPAADYTALQFSKYGVSSRQALEEDDLLGQGRDSSAPGLGPIDVDGDVGIPVDARSIGFWLKATFGDPVTTGAGPYEHIFTSGATQLPSLSLQPQNPDVPLYRTHSGAAVDKLSFALARSGLPSATVSLIAQGEANDVSARDAAPDVFAPQRFAAPQGQIKKGGAALGRVVSASLDFANNLDRIEVIRSDGLIDGAFASRAEATGRLTVRFDGSALYDDAIAGTPVDLEIGYVKDADTQMLIALHEVYLSRPSVSIDGPSGIQVDFDFRAAHNSAAGSMATLTLKNDVDGY